MLPLIAAPTATKLAAAVAIPLMIAHAWPRPIRIEFTL